MKHVKLLTWWQAALIRLGIFVAHLLLFAALIFVAYTIWNKISEVKVQVEDNSTYITPPKTFKIISEDHDDDNPHSEYIAQEFGSNVIYKYVIDRGHMIVTSVKEK